MRATTRGSSATKNEVIFAAYESAGTGRKVELPFETDAEKPYDLWHRPEES